VLPDGQRFISSRHASIDYRSGSYYIVDTSTNGVYVNGADTPVGRGNPQRLFNGDRVRLGEYEISVELDEEDNTDQQLADVNHIDPVIRAQRVPPPDPTRADLLPAHEITAVGIEVMISEEAEAGDLQRAAKLAVDSLRLEDEPLRRRISAQAAARNPRSPTEQPSRTGAAARRASNRRRWRRVAHPGRGPPAAAPAPIARPPPPRARRADCSTPSSAARTAGAAAR
jgi:type VI secretion system FHA domain protein